MVVSNNISYSDIYNCYLIPLSTKIMSFFFRCSSFHLVSLHKDVIITVKEVVYSVIYFLINSNKNFMYILGSNSI